MNGLKTTILILTMGIFFSGAVQADESKQVKNLIDTTVTSVLKILENKGMDQKTKGDKIIAAIDPVFNFQLMAKLSLGKKHWSSMSPKQKNEFVDLFIQQLKISYIGKAELFSEEKIQIDSPVPVGKKYQVDTRIISEGQPTSILYKLYKSNASWKVYDIEIEGVSIIKSYRSQYTQILNTGTIEDLMNKLRKKVEEVKN